MPNVYPVIVFRLSPDDREGVAIAENAIASTEFLKTENVFFDFNQTAAYRQLIIFVAENTSVLMKSSFVEVNIRQFIADHSLPLLASWSLVSIKSISELFASVFVRNSEEIEKYRELAKETCSVFVWGSAVNWTELGIERFNLTVEDLPGIVVLDLNRDRYFTLANASDLTAARKWLKKFEGEMENLTYGGLYLKEKRTRNRQWTWKPSPSITQSLRGSKTPLKKQGRLKEGLLIVLGTMAITIIVLGSIGCIGLKIYDARIEAKNKIKQD
jgi:hypothetical protein